MQIKNKKAVSLMISYVILISIGISLSIAVYVWLNTLSNVSPVTDCNEGTSLIIEDSSCDGVNLVINIKNNGRFNVSGVVVSVGNDTKKTPVTYLPAKDQILEPGFFIFVPELGPGDKRNSTFQRGDANFNYVRIVQIQPFIFSKKKKVLCSESIIKQNIPDCNIGP